MEFNSVFHYKNFKADTLIKSRKKSKISEKDTF